MSSFVLFSLLLLQSCHLDNSLSLDSRLGEGGAINPEASMSTPEIIRNRGFVCREYAVTTIDGYILELHRIGESTGHPVLLQHGLLSSSMDWVTNPTDQALGFRLASKGYDVWLSNTRGNTYSRRHVWLDPHRPPFWNFSVDDNGEYDVPANINYILNMTSHTKLTYVGHSMGTTMFFIAMTRHPELNDKIDTMIALAPVASMAHLASPVKAFAPHVRLIQSFLRLTRTTVFLSENSRSRRLQKNICQHTLKTTQFCENAIFFISGADSQNFNSSILAIIEGHFPAGTSVNTLAQFAQNYNQGRINGEQFTAFDAGAWANFRRHNSTKPPPYNLSAVKVPVHLFYGENDLLATSKDVAWLSTQLGNVKSTVMMPKFNHLDFIWGVNTNALLYDPILAIISPLVL